MLNKVFGSKTRINILKLFAFNPEQEYYLREIERNVGGTFEPIRRELISLEAAGILKSRNSGRQKYYSVNTNSSLYPELKALILKTVGLGDLIRGAIKLRDDIVSAFIYGSYANNTENADSDIDIFVVGDISSKDLQEILSGVEGQTKREINPTIYSVKEFCQKKDKNNFILSVLKVPKIFLKGDEDGLRRLVSGK